MERSWRSMRRLFAVTALIVCVAVYSISRTYLRFDLPDQFAKLAGTQQDHQDDVSLKPTGHYLINTSGCRLVRHDPFDPSVARFFKVPQPIDCSHSKPPLLQVTDEGSMQINLTVLKNVYGISNADQIECFHRIIRRQNNSGNDPTKWSDSRVFFDEWQPLQLGTPLKDPFHLVNCTSQGITLMTDLIPITPILNKTEFPSVAKDPDFSNVILLGLDSISKLNFLRHFFETKRFLEEDLQFDRVFALHGYTKVADNTFPNVVPLLTGKFIEQVWNESIKNYFFDDLDFVWKHYAMKGYQTLLAEDAPSIATFNYYKNGFRYAPTDHYFRPMAIAMENSKARTKSRKHCMGNKMEIEVLFDYLLTFIKSCRKHLKKFFAFDFVARLTHDLLNNAGLADKPSLRVLRALKDTGVLEDSVLVFFSDHGIRFGDIRNTYIGKIEERMPFIYVILPRSFRSRYPAATANLARNQFRLTTPFDVHATLLHLSKLQWWKDLSFRTEHGFSLFSDIPSNRTCSDASILPHWCPCMERTKLYIEDGEISIATNASEAIVKYVNDLLAPYPECVPLSLRKIRDAYVAKPKEELLRFVKHQNDVINRQVLYGERSKASQEILLTVVVSPSNATLEATIRYDEAKQSFTVLNDISRLDRYGDQSDCISDAKLKKYCFCRHHLTNFYTSYDR